MSEPPGACRELATALAAARDGVPPIPDPLPCAPLDLLIALHLEVTRTMLSDLAHAQRAAAAARAVAARYADDPLAQAQAHWSQGTAVLYLPDYTRSLGHYDAALAWYDRARELLASAEPKPDVRVVQIVRVFCLSEIGRYAEAQQAIETAEHWLRDHPNDYAQLTLLLNRSQLAGNMGDYAEQVALADATIALATRLNQPARVANGWINRAYACIYLGRFDEAAVALDQGTLAAERAGEPITVARAQYNRARLLRCRGELFAALTMLRRAQQGMAQAEGEAATILLEEAELYDRLRQLPEAQRAAQIAAEAFARQAMLVYSAGAALQAARVAIQQRQASAALALLGHARTQAEQTSLPVLEAEIAVTKAALATIPAAKVSARTLAYGRRAARASAQRAVATLQAHGAVQEAAAGRLTVAALDVQLGDTSAAVASYRDLASSANPQIRLAASAELGALLPPAEALEYLERAAALADEQRRALPMEELQARYSSETSPYHMRLAAACQACGQIARAANHVWAAKAGALLDLRAGAGPLAADVRLLLERTKAEIATRREQQRDHIRKAQDAARQQQHERAAYHSQRAVEADAEAQASERALTTALRTLGDRGGQARVPAFTEIQAALPPGTALLEYAEWDDILVCFLVRPATPPQCYRLGRYSTLAPQLDRWNIVCRRLMDDTLPLDAARQIQAVLTPLWTLLIAPLASALITTNHLLIAPYRILHHIPWAALFEGGAYLGDMFEITLTPSGAMWAAKVGTEPNIVGPPRLLGCAGRGEEQLTYVAAELAAITQHLPGALVYQQATAADLRASPAPRLLHIAAHGRTNSTAPLCSTIELADGPFLLLEAHRLNLRGTRLATLSACETSVRPDHGDIALALAGAFLCAGARAVLASLWRVSDAATAALMEQFYAGLAAGALPTMALRLAQRQVRVDHPLDWAAFQLWAGAQDPS